MDMGTAGSRRKNAQPTVARRRIQSRWWAFAFSFALVLGLAFGRASAEMAPPKYTCDMDIGRACTVTEELAYCMINAFASYDDCKENGGFWNGSVLIFTKAQDEATAPIADGYHIIFWEDDSTPCQLKTNINSVVNTITSVVGAVGAAALKGKVGWGLVAGSFLASVWPNNDWLLGNDDVIGDLVPSTIGWADGSNYTIMLGTTINGRAKIVEK